MDADPREQPIANERADNADDQVADKTKAAAIDDFSGEPSGDHADNHDDEQALVRQIHSLALRGWGGGRLAPDLLTFRSRTGFNRFADIYTPSGKSRNSPGANRLQVTRPLLVSWPGFATSTPEALPWRRASNPAHRHRRECRRSGRRH